MELNSNTKKIINLILIASSLQILEGFLPHPVPAARLGLANLVSLIAIVNYGTKTALQVVMGRTIVSAIFLGTFLSIPFILSFLSGIFSVLVMGGVFLVSSYSFLKFSILGISVFGAVFHNISQIFLVYFLFIKNKSILLLLPLLVVSGVISGVVIGSVAILIFKKLDEKKSVGVWNKHNYKSFTFLERKHIPELKISKIIFLCFMLVVLILVFFVNKVFCLWFLFMFLIFLYFFTRKNFSRLFYNFKAVLWILLFSFFLQVLTIKTNGLILGLIFVLKILNIVVFTSWLSQYYSKEEFIFILQKLFFFDKSFAKILAVSFYSLPEFLHDFKAKIDWIKNSNIKEIPNIISEILLDYF
ncbi:MAG: Gx transporter family protein [Endomicrobiia bacterium]